MSNTVPTVLRRSNCLRAGRKSLQKQPYRCLSCSMRLAQQPQQQEQQSRRESSRTTHFGFETIAEGLKQGRVANVFTSVASSYDTMNDLMSLGIHRLWKDHFVRGLDPGVNPVLLPPGDPQSLHILDVAGGTGDIAFRLLDYCTQIHGDQTSRVTVADINPDMLAEGRKRAKNSAYAATGRLDFVEANAESMPQIASSSVDLYTVAFGIRNFTDIPKALAEAFRVLRPGGVFACLEFSKVTNPLFNAAYKRWSFSAIPLIGQIVAGDRDSYQYLVESIERFPSQAEFRSLIKEAGFIVPGEGEGDADGANPGWENLSGGIACIHKGVKPASLASSM